MVGLSPITVYCIYADRPPREQAASRAVTAHDSPACGAPRALCELNGNVVRLHPHGDQRTVFNDPEVGTLDYRNWLRRRWDRLLKATAPDAEHPKREPVTGSPHMLRHSYATALIQSGENAKTVQTPMSHHNVAFTMDQTADAWPEALSNAGEKAAALLFAESGGKTVAAAGQSD